MFLMEQQRKTKNILAWSTLLLLYSRQAMPSIIFLLNVKKNKHCQVVTFWKSNKPIFRNTSANYPEGVRVGNNSLLALISTFSTDLKRFQTPHSSFRDSQPEQIKPLHKFRVQVLVQVLDPFCHLAINPEGYYSRRKSKDLSHLTAKSMSKILGQRVGLASWTGKHRHRAFPSPSWLETACSRCGPVGPDKLPWGKSATTSGKWWQSLLT